MPNRSGGFCQKHHFRRLKYGTTDAPPKAHLPLEDRFWRKVAKAGLDDCWLWTGYRNKQGYGYINLEGSVTGRAHRVSWEIANGQPVPEGRVVMHSCDNPSCVNPAHLSIGSQSDNLVDMVAKGRKHQNFVVGADHWAAVLTAEQVRYIRSCGKPSREVARELGVGKSTVLRVRSGRNWSHIK